jgi:AraC-like DNA-binding protein
MMADADWSGRVVFSDRYVLFTGRTGDNRAHSHLAVQVVIGADCCIELASGARISGTAIVIRPHVRHRLLPAANARVYMIEPTSDLGAALLAGLPDVPALVVADVQDRLDRLIAARLPAPLDPRLQTAMALVASADAAELPLSQAARRVGLSPERLRAIAARELGMPLARWRRWAALRRACEALAEGISPVRAAGIGGFSDQAHFNRTMRAMLGLTPAGLLKGLN